MVKLTTEQFIAKAIKVHGNKYDYSKVVYTGTNNKIIITCNNHGDYTQSPHDHIFGQGCPTCANTNRSNIRRASENDVLSRIKDVHKSQQYDYKKFIYTGSNNKCTVTCLVDDHGDFHIKPNHLLRGHGCKKCAIIEKSSRRKLTKIDFIAKASNIKQHTGKYNYLKVHEFKNTREKICITCKQHGDFYQTVSSHLSGKGCPICKELKGETRIRNYLTEHDIQFTKNKTFNDCKYIDILRFDFYLKEHNTIIEFDGQQHYIPIKAWGGDDALHINQLRDSIKNSYCKINNIRLLRIAYFDLNNIENIISDFLYHK